MQSSSLDVRKFNKMDASTHKKIRLEEVVIERAYQPAEILVKVIALMIDARETSSVLEMLCKEASLSDFGLLHLKRVRKLPNHSKDKVQIILCPLQVYHTRLCNNNLIRQLYESNCEGVEIVEVIKVSPQTKKEFQEWTKFWPMNFHPGELDRQRDRGISNDEIGAIENYVHNLLLDDENVKKRFEHLFVSTSGVRHFGGLIVNTVDNKLVCTTSEAIYRLEKIYEGLRFINNPILTPTMVCINHVASIARGCSEGQDNLPLGHYLCTNFDLYLMEEPDLMSCMALVHSRIRRVFFIHRHHEEGALLSGNGHIHSLKALNHHYRVFRVLVDSAELS